MGRRGPKPTPRALRLLRGQAVVTRHPAGGQPGGSPTMPEGLSVDEQASWAGLIDELGSVPGLIARADRGAIEMAARIEPALRVAAVAVRDHGSTLECFDAEGRLKFVQTRPEATFMLKAGALLKALYAELGLTPSGRSRVSLTPAAQPSKLNAFLSEGRRS